MLRYVVFSTHSNGLGTELNNWSRSAEISPRLHYKGSSWGFLLLQILNKLDRKFLKFSFEGKILTILEYEM